MDRIKVSKNITSRNDIKDNLETGIVFPTLNTKYINNTDVFEELKFQMLDRNKYSKMFDRSKDAVTIKFHSNIVNDFNLGHSSMLFFNERYILSMETSIYVSTNLINWASQTGGGGTLATNGSIVISTPSLPTVTYSTNAINWQSTTVTGITTAPSFTIFTNNTLGFVSSQNSNNTLLKSTNGINWTSNSYTGSYARRHMSWINNNTFSIAGGISTNLVNWTTATNHPSGTYNGYVNGYFFVGKFNLYSRSTNLINWENQSTFDNNIDIVFATNNWPTNTVYFKKYYYSISVTGGNNYNDGANYIVRSTDLLNWAYLDSKYLYKPYNLSLVNNRLFFTSNNGSLYEIIDINSNNEDNGLIGFANYDNGKIKEVIKTL